jgi:hypothetical protein
MNKKLKLNNTQLILLNDYRHQQRKKLRGKVHEFETYCPKCNSWIDVTLQKNENALSKTS